MRANFSTPRLVVPGAPEGVSKKEAFLLNDDLKPVPPALRTWSAFSYANFWVADGLWVLLLSRARETRTGPLTPLCSHFTRS